VKEETPLHKEWYQPGLDDLVERLREAGFPVGLSETLDAARLLREMAQRDRHLTSRESLRARLRPVFCKSSAAQARFDSIFDTWAINRLPLIGTLLPMKIPRHR